MKLTVGGAVVGIPGAILLPARLHQPKEKGGMWLSEFVLS
jgi:hypothetical protein